MSCCTQVKTLDNVLLFAVMPAISHAIIGKVTQLVAWTAFPFSAGWILVLDTGRKDKQSAHKFAELGIYSILYV